MLHHERGSRAQHLHARRGDAGAGGRRRRAGLGVGNGLAGARRLRPGGGRVAKFLGRRRTGTGRARTCLRFRKGPAGRSGADGRRRVPGERNQGKPCREAGRCPHPRSRGDEGAPARPRRREAGGRVDHEVRHPGLEPQHCDAAGRVIPLLPCDGLGRQQERHGHPRGRLLRHRPARHHALPGQLPGGRLRPDRRRRKRRGDGARRARPRRRQPRRRRHRPRHLHQGR